MGSVESIFTDTGEDNDSVLSSDEEFFFELDEYAELPPEVQEYQIAEETRREVPETGTTETVHFKLFPHKNMYLSGHRKFVGTLPKRWATRHNYQLNYHITVFKSLNSERPELRLKRLKEQIGKRGGGRRGGNSRVLDSSKMGNVVIVDVARYARYQARQAPDGRIPVINLRDGHAGKYWLSERVSALLLSRSPRLRFAIEVAKTNRAHWKVIVKDLVSAQRPFQYRSLYGGNAKFYTREITKFVTKPLTSRCLVYYADLYEENSGDHVPSKTYVTCLGNQLLRDSKTTPTVSFEDRLKEHLRAGQKLHDPKVSIFNVALQNPALALEEAGRLLPSKGSNEITKCPNLVFVPLDFGFSSMSKPATQDHLSALKQAYCDIFYTNGPAGYNV